ncbi:MAG: arylsulfotransferase family protein [Myxococcota bacterium]
MLALALAACVPSPPPEPALGAGPDVVLVTSDPARSEVASAGVLTVAFRLDEDGDGRDEEGWALEIRGDGTVAWAVAPPEDLRYGRAHRARDGATLIMEGVPEGATDEGRILRWTPDRGTVAVTKAPTSHHDVAELDDGRLAWLAHRFTDAVLDPIGEAPVVGDQVVIGAEGGQGSVLVDTLDDYPVPPWWICDHNTLGRRIPGYHELLHSNSLVRDPQGGGWLVMARYLDAILRFDDDGRFDWQLGGRDGDFAFDPGARFVHSHFTDAWGDRLLVFDNGEEHAFVDGSRVVELVVDREARTVQQAWSVERREHTRFLGDARRLPGGNTLVAWGNLGEIQEVTPAGEVVWAVDVGMPVGRVEWVP